MSLNENTIKYVPTSAKTGALISLCIAEQITDIERLGADGIIDSLYNPNKSFVGVITMAPSNIKNGGLYSLYNPEDMISIRLTEQQKAANIGSYNSTYILNHKNSDEDEEIIDDYVNLIKAYKPETIYTYSPFEENESKVRILKLVITAISSIVDDYHPNLVLGVSLDNNITFVSNDKLVKLGINKKIDFVNSMLSVYDSAKENNEDLTPSTLAINLSDIESVEDLTNLVTNLIDDYKIKILKNINTED